MKGYEEVINLAKEVVQHTLDFMEETENDNPEIETILISLEDDIPLHSKIVNEFEDSEEVNRWLCAVIATTINPMNVNFLDLYNSIGCLKESNLECVKEVAEGVLLPILKVIYEVNNLKIKDFPDNLKKSFIELGIEGLDAE